MSNIEKEPSFFQASAMGEFSNISLSPSQKIMYVERRKTEKNLTDQNLLASVIAQTDPDKLDPFLNAYPNIFSDKDEINKK